MVPRIARVAPAEQGLLIHTYLLHHRHSPEECRAVFAAWKGFASPLRRSPTLGSCPEGGHELYWRVEAADPAAALAQLPPYVASRTHAIEVSEVRIP